MQENKERLKILEQSEIDNLYALPIYTYEDRKHYFSLSQGEERLLKPMRTLSSKVYFILQLGFFRSKKMFFSFTQDEVYDDIQHILKYTLSETKSLNKLQLSKPTRLSQQQTFLIYMALMPALSPLRKPLMKKLFSQLKYAVSLFMFLKNYTIILKVKI